MSFYPLDFYFDQIYILHNAANSFSPPRHTPHLTRACSLMISWHDFQSKGCPVCGQFLSSSVDPQIGSYSCKGKYEDVEGKSCSHCAVWVCWWKNDPIDSIAFHMRREGCFYSYETCISNHHYSLIFGPIREGLHLSKEDQVALSGEWLMRLDFYDPDTYVQLKEGAIWI